MNTDAERALCTAKPKPAATHSLCWPSGSAPLIAEHGLAAESTGLFFEIFTDDLGEVDWDELAHYYLDAISQTN